MPPTPASLRERLEETLTVIRPGITGKLKLTLQSTNPIESMISTVRVINGNVKHWSSGDMCLRGTAAGMLEAETRFRKVEGYRGLATLAVKVEHDLLRKRQLDSYTSTRRTQQHSLFRIRVLLRRCQSQEHEPCAGNRVSGEAAARLYGTCPVAAGSSSASRFGWRLDEPL